MATTWRATWAGLRRAALAVAAAVAVAGTTGAAAATVWDNGHAATPGSLCDGAGYDFCLAGYTVYDDFTITSPVRIKRIIYDTYFSAPTNTYFDTIYSFWTHDPATHFASGPDFSYDAAGTLSSGPHNSVRVTDTSHVVILYPGPFWMGIENVFNPLPSSPSGYAASSVDRLGGAIQISDDGKSIVTGLPDQAFSLSTTVPEPASWALLTVGLGTVGGALRRRRTTGVAAAA